MFTWFKNIFGQKSSGLFTKYSMTYSTSCRKCKREYENSDKARICEDWDNTLGVGRWDNSK